MIHNPPFHAGLRVLPAKREDQFDQPYGQSDIPNRHRDLIRGVPIELRKLVQAVEKIQEQELTSEQRNACMGDYERYCKSVVPGGGLIIACLAKQSDKLAPSCKKVLEAAEKK